MKCGGKCCAMLREFDSDVRCKERISCDRKLPCVLFLCNRAEDFLHCVLRLGDERWSGFHAVLQEVTDVIVKRLETLEFARPDAYCSPYSHDDVEDLTFNADYPHFTDWECLKAKEKIAS